MLCVFLLCTILPVSAAQSGTGTFSGGCSLTGHAAFDMVSAAAVQLGMTKVNPDHSGALCTDFVCGCAEACGQTNAIPSCGGCRELYIGVLSAGGRVVTERKPGDLVFCCCTGCGGYVHVGVVADGTYSYETDRSGRVSKVSNAYRDSKGHSLSSGTVWRVYVRPNYSGSSAVTIGTIAPSPFRQYNAAFTVKSAVGTSSKNPGIGMINSTAARVREGCSV